MFSSDLFMKKIRYIMNNSCITNNSYFRQPGVTAVQEQFEFSLFMVSIIIHYECLYECTAKIII